MNSQSIRINVRIVCYFDFQDFETDDFTALELISDPTISIHIRKVGLDSEI
jgi:hypothetical protein